ncbi:uncharacterized protein ELE39_001014 [Cryptosporidium sp. chipmunk genotype I]|uniref:uncharacterized protein n=1 Tax=Cryptosporidium sp. chipmunk genotype I TaxID=1280935 RepID=UPI00351A249C|nr:hypothetical protein ELE39_001014 [Cryptosporidium sp. chipmunk genotype I]
MRLNAATLITIISLINQFFGLYQYKNLKQISKYGNNSLYTSSSLLEILKRKPKRKKKYIDSTEVSDLTLNSEIESKNQDLVDKDKKKKRNKFKRGLKRIPKFFSIFRRKNRNSKIKSKNKHRKEHPVDNSVSIEEDSAKPTDAVGMPKTKQKPEFDIGLDSESKFEPKVEDSIKPSQVELSNENSLENINNWEVSKLINGMNDKSYLNSVMNELKDKLKFQQGKHDQIDFLIVENNPTGEEIAIGMKYEQFYNYLDHHVSANTGGITPMIKLSELISSINIDQKLLDLEPNNNAEKAIKNIFRIENENYKVKLNPLFNLYSQNFGQECTFSWMDDLITMHYNAFMEFKSTEEEYQYLLDPRKSTPIERARNLSRAYYEMKAAKSKLREILMKYLNCHIITLFFIRIDDINVGKHEEKCSAQDLITLLYYQNIFLALKKLYYLTLKKKESEVAELNQMLISGFESLSEESKVKYKVLMHLSHKLFSLSTNANLYQKLVKVIDEKLSLCLAYIVNNYRLTQEKSSRL